MLRVTADTNIFISGLNFKGKSFELLTLARDGAIDLAISDPIMAQLVVAEEHRSRKAVAQKSSHWLPVV